MDRRKAKPEPEKRPSKGDAKTDPAYHLPFLSNPHARQAPRMLPSRRALALAVTLQIRRYCNSR